MSDHFLREFGVGDFDVRVTGSALLPSAFAVTDFAAASIAAAGCSTQRLARLLGAPGAASITVDRRLASLWFGFSIVPDGWALPPTWDDLAGDYETADGWIKLHTNAARHRAAALSVLGCEASKSAVSAAVRCWSGAALESAVVDAGGCAGQLRDAATWMSHPQGAAVAGEPLLAVVPGSVAGSSIGGAAAVSAASSSSSSWSSQPLRGVRVLDLTRILAGPVATRFLAGLGADVLRIDPVDWDEPSLAPEVTLGKRCARLDLCTCEGRARFSELLADADILIHGYRPSALDDLGFGAPQRALMAPGLVEVTLDAYGWSGPWAGRRGFDSLVQMSSGIAAAGQEMAGAAKPVSLPVQALDHATGYLMAAAAIDGWCDRLDAGRGSVTRASLARTAKVLLDGPSGSLDAPFAGVTATDLAGVTAADPAAVADIEHTAWGPARRVRFPLHIPGVTFAWPRPANPFGSEPTPAWLPR
ncbi:MAG: CoA transferase [Ilumatobacteraceae bacterium]